MCEGVGPGREIEVEYCSSTRVPGVQQLVEPERQCWLQLRPGGGPGRSDLPVQAHLQRAPRWAFRDGATHERKRVLLLRRLEFPRKSWLQLVAGWVTAGWIPAGHRHTVRERAGHRSGPGRDGTHALGPRHHHEKD